MGFLPLQVTAAVPFTKYPSVIFAQSRHSRPVPWTSCRDPEQFASSIQNPVLWFYFDFLFLFQVRGRRGLPKSMSILICFESIGFEFTDLFDAPVSNGTSPKGS